MTEHSDLLRVRLDRSKPFARIYGAGDDPDIPRGAWALQDGRYFRADGTDVDDPPDPPKPVLTALPADNPDTPVLVDAEIWEKYRKMIYGPPEGDGEVA